MVTISLLLTLLFQTSCFGILLEDLKPISCELCRGPKFICERAHASQQCQLPAQQYCINDVENLRDGSRYVSRRCATKAECEKDWVTESADRHECKVYDVDVLQAAQFTCSFCCKGDNCNYEAVPTNLYGPTNTTVF